MDRILNMILRQITRRLINKGIGMGIDKASSMGKGKAKRPPSQGQTDANAEAARQTKQAARMMRRSTRM